MTIVFDTQALMAHLQGEAGAEQVRELLRSVEAGTQEAFCSVVNLAEVSYLARRRAPEKADETLAWLLHLGIQPVGANDAWRDAADIKSEGPIALADAFALVTAVQKRGLLVTGDDPDFDIAPRLGVELLRV